MHLKYAVAVASPQSSLVPISEWSQSSEGEDPKMGDESQRVRQVMIHAGLCAVLALLAGCTSGTTDITPPPVGRHVQGQTPIALYFPPDSEDREFKEYLLRRQMEGATRAMGEVTWFCISIEGADPTPEFLSLFASERGSKVIPGSKRGNVRDGSVAIWVTKTIWLSKNEAYAECGWHAGFLAAQTWNGWYLKKDGRWIPLEGTGTIS
jgi:hypothetical protein